MLEELKQQVWKENKKLCSYGLITLTWGNVSGIDRASGLVVIKPSGLPYEEMQPEDMVVVDLEGNKVEGKWNPSSDLPTHLVLEDASEILAALKYSRSVCFWSGRHVCACRSFYGSWVFPFGHFRSDESGV